MNNGVLLALDSLVSSTDIHYNHLGSRSGPTESLIWGQVVWQSGGVTEIIKTIILDQNQETNKFMKKNPTCKDLKW